MQYSVNGRVHRRIILVVWLLLLVGLEPALANKFETIGGGVSGLSDEKVQTLKQISFYGGGFLLFLGTMGLLSRNRFEGFIGYARRGELSPALKGAIALGVIGSLLIGISYL